MSLTLELPSELSKELKQQAVLIGLPAEEYATDLLRLAAALLELEDSGALEDSSDEFLADVPADKRDAVAIFEWITRLVLDEGTLSRANSDRLSRFADRLRAWRTERQVDQLPLPEAIIPSRTSVMGKYAHIPGTSDDFVRLKQEEIDREDRRSA